MTKTQELKNRQERVMNAIIESAKARRKIIEKYLECYGEVVERGKKEYIVKQLGTKIETVDGNRIISAIIKTQEKPNKYKIIRDFF